MVADGTPSSSDFHHVHGPKMRRSRPQTRSSSVLRGVYVRARRTTLRLAPVMWDALADIVKDAAGRCMTISPKSAAATTRPISVQPCACTSSSSIAGNCGKIPSPPLATHRRAAGFRSARNIGRRDPASRSRLVMATSACFANPARMLPPALAAQLLQGRRELLEL
jgi:hypothetical protein